MSRTQYNDGNAEQQYINKRGLERTGLLDGFAALTSVARDKLDHSQLRELHYIQKQLVKKPYIDLVTLGLSRNERRALRKYNLKKDKE